MSKTYRRKNQDWDLPKYKYEVDLGGALHKIKLDPNSKEYKKKVARYHSDNIVGESVPHQYINLVHERKSRMKTKKELHNWKKNPDEKEVILDKYRKDAGYYYF